MEWYEPILAFVVLLGIAYLMAKFDKWNAKRIKKKFGHDRSLFNKLLIQSNGVDK